ncbi:MAG: PKD domain-containing protein [Candidatus Bathyarchaeia archaeon]
MKEGKRKLNRNEELIMLGDVDQKKSMVNRSCIASSCMLIALLALSLLNNLLVFPVEANPATLEVLNPLDGTNYFRFATDTTFVGDTFVINITVVEVTDLCSWQIALKWNASLLEVSEIWLPSDNVFAESGRPPLTAGPYVEPGFICYFACVSPYGPYWTFNGTGTLCQIKMRIIQEAPAESDLYFVNPGWDTFLLDGVGSDISFSPVNGYYIYRYPDYAYKPIARFTYHPKVPLAGEYMMFDASISINGWNGTNSMPIISYAWDFETDGVVDAYGVTVTHAYAFIGTYLVTLNVTDSRGLWDIEMCVIEVVREAATFSIVYYDNYNYKTGQWEAWENWDTSSQPHYLWNAEYLVNFTSGKTKATTHYLANICDFDLRGGFWSLDGHFTDEDWNPLKSIGDTVSGMSPHHMFAAIFTGWVYFKEGDTLTLESDDDAYIFLDDKTEWGQEILSEPGIHYFYSTGIIITAELAGYHLMTVKFAERHDIHSGIQINLNGVPIRATPPPIPVYVDIKPGSWPNPININSEGEFAVAICGTEDFDVMSVDPGTVKLYIEGVEEGVIPLCWSYEDVATPFTGEPGGGHALRGDGYVDLLFHFDAQAAVTILNLFEHISETIPLIIKGNLYKVAGGVPIQGQDYVRILRPRRYGRLLP